MTEQPPEEKAQAEKRSKAIDKIKKCLALAKSANEHEAAAALRQAQKLMKAYNIDELEVEGEVVVRAHTDTREKFSRLKPDSLVSITHLIGTAFGVMITWSCSPSGRHRITYWGSYAAVTIAVHAHKMVYKAADERWEEYKQSYYRHQGRDVKPPKTAKPSFVIGWCQSVKDKVENLAPKNEQFERMKRAAEAKMGMEPGELGTVEERKKGLEIDNHAAWYGLKAGKDFNLHQPIGEVEPQKTQEQQNA